MFVHLSNFSQFDWQDLYHDGNHPMLLWIINGKGIALPLVADWQPRLESEIPAVMV